MKDLKVITESEFKRSDKGRNTIFYPINLSVKKVFFVKALSTYTSFKYKIVRIDCLLNIVIMSIMKY